MLDVVEIYQHWNAGRPKAVIAESLGVDPKTIRKYVKLAEEREGVWDRGGDRRLHRVLVVVRGPRFLSHSLCEL